MKEIGIGTSKAVAVVTVAAGKVGAKVLRRVLRGATTD